MVAVKPKRLINNPPVTSPIVEPIVATQVRAAAAVARCSRSNSSARRLKADGT